MTPRYYRVWCPDRGQSREEGIDVLATSARLAAEHWADNDDYQSVEFRIVGGESVRVLVENDDGDPICFEVTGKAIRTYLAKEVPA